MTRRPPVDVPLPSLWVLKADDPDFGMSAGDLLVCFPYWLDPDKLTVFMRLPDGFDPSCNVYRSQVRRAELEDVTKVVTAPLIAAERDAALARERERVAVLSVEVAGLRRGLGSCRMRAALLRKALDEAQDAEETLDDLRAKVDALDYEMLGRSEYVRKDDVLALLDGSSDD